MPREFSNLRAGVTLKDDHGNEFRQWPWIKLEPLDKILCSDIYLDFKVTLRELNSATKEAARQGVRPSEDPKAIKIYTRLRQIETALHGLQRELNEKRGNRKNAATKKPVTASL